MVTESLMNKYQLTKSLNAYLVSLLLIFGQNFVIFITSRDSTGEQYLMGGNLKIVWAEFSALSRAVLLNNKYNARHANGHFRS